MKAIAAVFCLFVGCGHSDAPKTTSFGDFQQVMEWFPKKCGLPRYSMAFTDATVPEDQSYLYAFECSASLLDIQAPHVELRGTPRRLCSVRIGPAAVTKPIDPSFVAEWFEDKALAEKVAKVLAGLGSNQVHRRVSVVDGVTVAVVQEVPTAQSLFFLSIDACGRVADRGTSSL